MIGFVVDIWWFPKMGVPPNHPCFHRIFHEISHSFLGITMTTETTVYEDSKPTNNTVGAPPFRYVSCVNKSMYIILILHHVNSDNVNPGLINP